MREKIYNISQLTLVIYAILIGMAADSLLEKGWFIPAMLILIILAIINLYYEPKN